MIHIVAPETGATRKRKSGPPEQLWLLVQKPYGLGRSYREIGRALGSMEFTVVVPVRLTGSA
jgi:hypothetical protein